MAIQTIWEYERKPGRIFLNLSPKTEKALNAWLSSDTWHLIHPFDDKLWKAFANCISQCENSVEQEELIEIIAQKAIRKGEKINLQDLHTNDSYIGLAGVIRDRVESLHL